MLNPIFFNHPIRVKKEDLDELNHVNNVVYISYLQEAAIAHWHSSVPQEDIDNIRWVVRKHEIEYLKPAFENEALVITTWVSAFTPVTSVRHYEIKRKDEVLIKATTLWIALNAGTMKPFRISKSISESFFHSSVL
jgi:acyl-CoA thioester hydrolase